LKGHKQEDSDGSGVYHEIGIDINCKVSDKRDIEVIVEGMLVIVRRITDFRF
jgi:hypothetical protein